MKRFSWAILMGFVAAAPIEAQNAWSRGCEVFGFVQPSYSCELEFNALYLQPLASNLHYAAVADPLPTLSPHWFIHDLKTDYHFAYDAAISLFFCEGGGRLKANYVHFNSDDSEAFSVESTYMVGPFFEIGPDALLYTEAAGKVSFDYDAANLNYGVALRFGSSLQATLFAGASALRLKETLTSVYSNSDHTIVRSIVSPSSFEGIGPQLGLDFSYNFCSGIELRGKGALTCLMGTLKNDTSFTSISPLLGTSSPNDQSTSVDSRTQMVPGFESKLGLSTMVDFCDCVWRLDAGYQVVFYANAIQTVDIGSEVVTPPVAPDTVGVYARTFQRNISSFTLAGPYVTMSVAF